MKQFFFVFNEFVTVLNKIEFFFWIFLGCNRENVVLITREILECDV